MGFKIRRQRNMRDIWTEKTKKKKKHVNRLTLIWCFANEIPLYFSDITYKNVIFDNFFTLREKAWKSDERSDKKRLKDNTNQLFSSEFRCKNSYLCKCVIINQETYNSAFLYIVRHKMEKYKLQTRKFVP